MFDRDGNGFISKQELGMAMRSLGYMPNEVELEVIIQRLDMDGEETHTVCKQTYGDMLWYYSLLKTFVFFQAI